MSRLTARYVIDLDYPILHKRSDDDSLAYTVSIEGAEVRVTLIRVDSGKSKQNAERLWTKPTDKLEILVSFPESEEMPSREQMIDVGQARMFAIDHYFDQRVEKFGRIAEIVCRRIERFFQFEIGTPFLGQQDRWSEFRTPTWLDENENEIAVSHFRSLRIQGLPGATGEEFGINRFQKSHDRQFVSALAGDREVSLHEELLSDAKNSILSQNHRRGILEMAIACEVAVKQMFFADEGVTSITFDYLEYKGNLRVSTLELIHKVAENAFGESFKTFNSQAYEQVDYLFRCRNKIAHRGKATYIDVGGSAHVPDLEEIRRWWNSVELLLGWLSAKKKQLES